MEQLLNNVCQKREWWHRNSRYSILNWKVKKKMKLKEKMLWTECDNKLGIDKLE